MKFHIFDLHQPQDVVESPEILIRKLSESYQQYKSKEKNVFKLLTYVENMFFF